MGTWLAHFHKKYRKIGHRDRTMLMSLGSFSINALIDAGKLILGLFLFSPWLISTAVYYIMLCGARGQLLWRYQQTHLFENPAERFERQFAVFRHSGIFLHWSVYALTEKDISRSK